MPKMACKVGDKPGWKWGSEGHCYTYKPGDEKSSGEAAKRAYLQGVAIGGGKLEKESLIEFNKAMDTPDIHVNDALGQETDEEKRKRIRDEKERCMDTNIKVKKDAESTEYTFESYVSIVKVDAPLHKVYGVVLEPWTVDLQLDVITPAEIEKASDLYMMRSQTLGYRHKGKLTKAKAYIVQNFIAPCDFWLDGSQLVLKDSWVMVTKVEDEELWKQIEKGEITGYSIGGRGHRTPAA